MKLTLDFNKPIIEEKRKIKVCDLTIQYKQFQFFPLFVSCATPPHLFYFFFLSLESTNYNH